MTSHEENVAFDHSKINLNSIYWQMATNYYMSASWNVLIKFPLLETT